jgi:hypothetical protein
MARPRPLPKTVQFPEEFIFVSKSFRISGRFLLSTTVAILALSASGLLAQTAPSLVPTISKLIAGGGTSVPAKGGLCPVSGYIATDAYGDGCLATEVLLGTSAAAPGPRGAVADTSGNVYFSDYPNGLVHRVDAITGIMTAFVGGPTSSPAANATCGTLTSTDARGDGCLGTLVHLSHPTFFVFDTVGNLYISDYGYGEVRKITGINGSVASVTITGGGTGYTTAPTVTFSAAPNGGTTATGTAVLSGTSVVSVTIVTPGSGYTTPPTVTFSAPASGTTATGTAAPTGVISLIAGSPSGTGYNISTNTATVTAAQSQLAGPYGIALDNLGDLIIADEYDASLDVLNLNTTGSNTVASIPVPAGTIWKIAGTVGTTGTSGSTYCTAGSGCTYNHTAYTEGGPANTNWLYNAYTAAVDSNGYVYTTNEYLDTIVRISPAGLMTTYVGTQNANGKSTTRGVAPNVTIGSPFGLAIDTANNLYFTDAADGTIWRVDATSQDQYLIASGFGQSGTGFASTKLPGPGIFGISVDSYEDLFFADTENNNVREIASGTQFGAIGANRPTQTVEIHFPNADLPASSGAYVLTSGNTNFALGTATCNATNSDGTTDCFLPITATPTVLGPFTGMLQVTSAKGQVSSFKLNGTFVQSPTTLTSVTYSAGVTCAGSTTFATTAVITLTATIAANGPTPPTTTADTVTFFANGTQLGSPVQVTNTGTSASPVYTASLPYTFVTAGAYTVTAVFSGDSYFKTSTGKLATTITTSLPGYTITPVSYQQGTVTAGQTALYSFNVAQNVYTGTISFAVSGLPANSSYALNPATITGAGCSSVSTVALSIITQQKKVVTAGGFGVNSHGRWQLFSIAAGLGLALLIGLRRRSLPLRSGQLMLALALLLTAAGTVGCGKAVGTVLQPATPTGTYTITVTPSATAGTAPAPITFTLTVQ